MYDDPPPPPPTHTHTLISLIIIIPRAPNLLHGAIDHVMRTYM